MGVTQMSLEPSATLPRVSSSRGSVPLRPPMPDLTLRNAAASVDSGHGSSAGSTRSILCPVRTAAVPCGSLTSSSIGASSARSWLTWLPREEGPTARLRRLSRLRARWPYEARRQSSASCMAKLCAAHASPSEIRPDRASCPRSRPTRPSSGWLRQGSKLLALANLQIPIRSKRNKQTQQQIRQGQTPLASRQFPYQLRWHSGSLRHFRAA